jgi:transposase
MMNDDVAASARPTGRMSARMQRIELISRRERHRQWTIEQKRTAVEEMLAPGANVSDVARKYEINTGQLYTWRRLMLAGKLGELPAAAPGFVRVDVVGATSPASIRSRLRRERRLSWRNESGKRMEHKLLALSKLN